jgi:aminoglycoside/choline kinase family phosphotransferase
MAMTTDDAQVQAFLQGAGWQDAAISALAGDASARRYYRLGQGGQTAILMVSPLGGVDDPAQFVIIAQHLARLNLSPPKILAQSLAQGLLLLEDLGDGLYAHLLHKTPEHEAPLYRNAIDVLAYIQRHAPPPNLPSLTPSEWASAAMLVSQHYTPALGGHITDNTALHAALGNALARHADAPRVMILRDYHAENLMHLPQRQGLAQVGLLDFQLAQMGQSTYDLVSLLQDARRDVSPATVQTMQRHWVQITGGDWATFSASYAAVGAQRALRILGIFARLCTHQGKAGYVDLIPRVWQHLQVNLAHPALGDLAAECARALPAPTHDNLSRLRSQCKTCP